jgi:hypothetical protein
VHHSGISRSERKTGLFGDREGVDVGPEGDPGPVPASRNVRQDACPTDPAGLETELGEPPLDPLGGPRLFPAGLGVTMEVPTNGDQTTRQLDRDGG